MYLAPIFSKYTIITLFVNLKGDNFTLNALSKGVLMKTKNQISCIVEKNKLESYLAIVATIVKGRSTMVIEYQRNSIPEVISGAYVKEGKVGVPVLADADLPLHGIQQIMKYLDMRYPLPELEGGTSQEYGFRMAMFTNFYDEFMPMFESYKASKKKSSFYAHLEKIASAMEKYLHYNALSLQYEREQPTSVQCLLVAVLLMMEDNNLQIDKMKGFRRFYQYMMDLKEQSGFIKARKSIDDFRESTPFWEREGFDINLYKQTVAA
tara:strand:- start:24812 stop:25606 length:795 start_codon:yes stop_codon:yes gene_type:complete